ncbi:hypothetical protein CNYM01_13791 [Colletotrichum nymphaeae SA-01]|uniref:Heterokaryon incompatibility domain-containing protein n=1 Tax=Colletotrichum nymphaeae SA-01 TaxID=1460502 RepID=A0A135SKJ5_9PEZI|nr:hypothetical protein CNYM01_13791 [Colletotrichum nymphaeae SA-01]
MEDPSQLSLSEIQDAIHQLDKNGPGARPLLQDPARQIRLFTLWPGTQESPIQGVFSVATLDDGPDYQCISYVWGDAADTKDITVDGKEFKITASLFSVLRRIRSEQEYLIVWADALCINQEVHEEKRVQVDMMFEIYSKCSNCFLWLGEVDLLDGELNLDIARYGLDFIEFLDGREREDNAFLTAEGLTKICLTLRSLVECQWWQRIWTIQECVAPCTATFLWGPLAISRSPLISFGNNINAMAYARCWCTKDKEKWHYFVAMGTLISMVTRLSRLRNQVKSGSQAMAGGAACTGFLWDACDHQASDPRDKIFALAPFITGVLTSAKSSNYDIDCVELYSRVTVDLIRSCQSLLPLMGQRQSEAPLEEPSWVLDWRRQKIRHYEEADSFCNTFLLELQFDASRGIPELDFQDFVSSDGQRLILRGYFIDELVGTFMPPSLASSGSDHPYSFTKSIKGLMKSWKHVAEGVFSTLQELGGPSVSNEAVAKLSELWDDMEEASIDALGPPESDDWQKDKNSRMLFWLGSRIMTIFILSEGRLGVGPWEVRPGDEIWILCSGHMPLILRPIRNNREQGDGMDHVGGSDTFVLPGKHDRYHLVCDCYIPGIMNGELSFAGNSILRTITLC